MKKIIICALIYLSFGFFADTPTLKLAKSSAEKIVNDWSKGKVELIEFTKTDGQFGDMFGVKTYAFDFKGKVRYNESGYIGKNKGDRNQFVSNVLKIEQKISKSVESYYIKVEKGDLVEIEGYLDFQKKESGWIHKNLMSQIRLKK
ncbi:hypothetical protein AAIP55_001783 [Flavobacterium psychrophilum]|uniref:Uncharacterized protein n=1 Tax=Flavobacterium psychrophilum TaxID=96345 RepID=A0A7U2NHG0_FLAPS|nr:hypothetical protein [Flavobacterium psychrophilum]EKT3956235.1 hypothetical protein [Flavobacterium psychrophilum]EKT3964227.1 hypothetical protein [Flavobacterium psychrophilum]EKT3965221.1 hypothetical protein [Flavobacterium psychrophilum]EKT4510163.1 hypothetical protein [Flavobacterium psychrophilum]EKT4517681.1 hypothetical protein [Flavobacterium psychrophilum]